MKPSQVLLAHSVHVFTEAPSRKRAVLLSHTCAHKPSLVPIAKLTHTPHVLVDLHCTGWTRLQPVLLIPHGSFMFWCGGMSLSTSGDAVALLTGKYGG